MYEHPMQKTVLITGGTRGIGLAVARRLGADGHALALSYREDTAQAEQSVRALREAGSTVRCYRSDLADPMQALGLAGQVAADFGRIDVLVNNAGITDDGPFLTMPFERVERVLQTNLGGSMRVTAGALPYLLAGPEPHIVNVASLGGINGKEGQVAYACSKGALIGFTRWLGRVYGGRGLRVNAVAPGFIRTDMVSSLRPEAYHPVLAGTALARMGEADEIADAVAFLLQPGYMQSTTLRLDGGFLR
jgi:3-oxoacyl-[acyl-carrier protein] reductase